MSPERQQSTPDSGVPTPFSRLSPRPTIISGYAHRGPPPLRPGTHPYVALGGRPEPPPRRGPLTAAPSPRPLAGTQGLLTYPEVGLGSTPGAGLRWRSSSARRGRCCPGTPPRGPGGRRGPAPGGRGLRRGRDAGRGRAAAETHGGIARHRAGQLRSARLRCWLRSRHSSQSPPGAKPEPRLAGGEEGPARGGASGWWEGLANGAGSCGRGLWWAGPWDLDLLGLSMLSKA